MGKNSLWSDSDWKAVKVSCVGFFIWFLFEPYFIELWDKYIVLTLLSRTNELKWPFVIGAVLLLISCVVFSYKSYKEYKTFFPYKYLVFIATFILVYLIYRFQGTYVYYPDYLGIGILDLIVLSLSVFIIFSIYCNNFRREGLSKGEGFAFYHDRPIENQDGDILGFQSTVDLFYLTIQNTLSKDKRSFSIGITGIWGEGKSSFLLLLRECFKNRKDKYIVLTFNPRHAKSKELIQLEFFQLLFDELKMYNVSFSSVFTNYLKAINVVDNSKVFDFLRQGHEILFNKEDEKEKINKAICLLNKKIVVFIEDLDRLVDDEILEVCKLLDGNASFNNMLFITAYDKNYVNNILKNYNHGTGDFIDKFFTVEKPLPTTHKRAYFKFFRSEVVSFFEDESLGIILDHNEDIFLDNFHTLRDVKRFLNNFIDDYSYKRGYLDFEDMFLLYVIKFKFKNVYNDLQNLEAIDTDFFLEIND